MPEDLLFIDPDQTLTAALSVYLTRQQFRVRCVGSWAAACDSLDDDFSGVVMLDPDLPDIDGYGVLDRVKANGFDMPLIVLADPGRLERAMIHFQAAALSYLVKPVKSLELDIALHHARDKLTLYRKIDRYTREFEDLHSSHILYQQLFDEVPCYISVQDRQYRLTAMNRLFKQDFGDQIGDYCYKIYKHRSSPCRECPVAKTFEDGCRHQTEEVVTSRTGQQYNVLTWTAPIKNDRGEITQVMEMATNITQIRRLQDHLTSLGLMLGSMSHGVKGMLTALDGGVYQLEMGIQKNDRTRIELAFQRIEQSSDRIRKMVLEILYYAKSRGMQYETTPVKAFFETVAQAIEPVVEKHNISLNFQVDGNPGEFEVDPSWIQQALVNFLENAVDACTVDRDKISHRLDFSVRSDGDDSICIEISDNGIGMDEETRRKIFTLFFSSKGSKGTGLGPVSYTHLRAHET